MNRVEYQRMFEAEERHWWYAGMRAISFALLADHWPKREGSLLLDAGCGTGNILGRLERHGRAVGVDLSEDAVEFSASRGVVVVRGSLVALPFRSGRFDVVTCFDVLYHRWIADDRAALVELTRVLKPGGLLLLRLPAFEWLRRAHDEAVFTRHRYTRGEVRALLAAAGLEVIRATYCNSLLLPMVVLRSRLDSLFGGAQQSDLRPLPWPLAPAFRGLLETEARLLRHVSLPLGASVMALGRKRDRV